MKYSVLLTNDAAVDLEDLYSYLQLHAVDGRAEKVLEEIERTFSHLSQYPERGAIPRELLHLGIREFREIHFKPYRIFYRIVDTTVYIMLISDGRRDMMKLLESRLINK
jgi:toxin ParE1/3/4